MKQIRLGGGFFATVDDDDYEYLMQWKWYNSSRKKRRAVTKIDGKTAFMHRLIMNVTDPDLVVDHINHDALDNRKCNLRVCTRSQNDMNRYPKPHTSKFKGVHWNSYQRKWQAQSRLKGKRLYLGVYDDEVEAAKAYDRYAVDNYGEFACTNAQMFPDLVH